VILLSGFALEEEVVPLGGVGVESPSRSRTPNAWCF
jgi:hypothetical protein